MRRKNLLTLLGCIGAVITVAVVVRRAAMPLRNEKDGVRATSSAGQLASTSSNAQMQMAASASENGNAAEHGKGEEHKKSGAQLLHDAMAALRNLGAPADFRKREAAVAELVRNLRAAGPEGLEALRKFFRADQDLMIGNGFGMAKGRMSCLYTFRIAMLDALADWPAPEALALTEEIFRSTPQLLEAEIALVQLETNNPGSYRGEAMERLKQASNASAEIRGRMWELPFYALMSHYQAPELIQIAEDANPRGRSAAIFLTALASYPNEMKVPAIERLFSRPETAKRLSENPSMFHDIPYGEPPILGIAQ